jgi:hypothetical protein
MTSSQHAYEVRPRKDHRGVDLIPDALSFGQLWPASQDRARIVFDCRMADDPAMMSCALQWPACQDTECGTRAK